MPRTGVGPLSWRRVDLYCRFHFRGFISNHECFSDSMVDLSHRQCSRDIEREVPSPYNFHKASLWEKMSVCRLTKVHGLLIVDDADILYMSEFFIYRLQCRTLVLRFDKDQLLITSKSWPGPEIGDYTSLSAAHDPIGIHQVYMSLGMACIWPPLAGSWVQLQEQLWVRFEFIKRTVLRFLLCA